MHHHSQTWVRHCCGLKGPNLRRAGILSGVTSCNTGGDDSILWEYNEFLNTWAAVSSTSHCFSASLSLSFLAALLIGSAHDEYWAIYSLISSLVTSKVAVGRSFWRGEGYYNTLCVFMVWSWRLRYFRMGVFWSLSLILFFYTRRTRGLIYMIGMVPLRNICMSHIFTRMVGTED